MQGWIEMSYHCNFHPFMNFQLRTEKTQKHALSLMKNVINWNYFMDFCVREKHSKNVICERFMIAGGREGLVGSKNWISFGLSGSREENLLFYWLQKQKRKRNGMMHTETWTLSLCNNINRMNNDARVLSLLYLGFPCGAVTSFSLTNYEIIFCDDLFIAMELSSN